MLGFTREGLLEMPISAIHPNEMPILQAFAQSVFKNGSGWTNELSCLTKNGQSLPSEISASIIDVDGRSHIIAMVRDITERRQAEKAERDLALVEERNRLAGEIHDSLAQGLTAIIWQLNAAERPVQTGGAEGLKSLESVRQLARESLQEARRSYGTRAAGRYKNSLWWRRCGKRLNKSPKRELKAPLRSPAKSGYSPPEWIPPFYESARRLWPTYSSTPTPVW